MQAHLPPITILPEAPVASSLQLLCRTPAESEVAAARAKLERVISGLTDVQDAFPYKMESSIYVRLPCPSLAFSRIKQ